MLSAVLDALSDPVIVTDSAWRILLANQGALATFRYDRPELLGRRLDVLLPVAAPGSRLLGRRKDGVEFPIDIRVREAQSRSGPLAIVCIRDSMGRRNGGPPTRRRGPAGSTEPLQPETINESRNALGILSLRIDVMQREADEAGLPATVREDLCVLRRTVERLAASLEGLLACGSPV